jgi:hypothetical protein
MGERSLAAPVSFTGLGPAFSPPRPVVTFGLLDVPLPVTLPAGLGLPEGLIVVLAGGLEPWVTFEVPAGFSPLLEGLIVVLPGDLLPCVTETGFLSAGAFGLEGFERIVVESRFLGADVVTLAI